MPTISVIVPVYKVEPYLRRCVDSILGQTFSDFELILVDDGSPDSCGAICEEYAAKDQRVHVIHRENGGVSAARNTGIDWVFANSGSQWITIIDSDDWIHRQYLSLLLDAATRQNVPISMCRYSRTLSADQPQNQLSNVPIKTLSPGEAYIFNSEEAGVSSFAWGRLYHRSCFVQIRYPEGKLWEDLFTTYKLLYACPGIAVVDAVLYYYYQNDAGIVRSPWRTQKLDSLGGYEQQLQFFSPDRDGVIYRRLAAAYVAEIAGHLALVQAADISEGTKRDAEKLLRAKMRCAIRRYHKVVNFLARENRYYCEIAFPRMVRFIRLTKAALSGIRNTLTRK